MKNIQLIIDRNFAGYDIIFNKEISTQFVKLEAAMDEREVAQISNKGGLFIIYNNQASKVYSYVDDSVTDASGRNGFFAIRLIIPSTKNLKNVNEVLLNIANKFKTYLKQNDFQNQNYDDILNSVVIEEEKQLILVPETEKAKFYHYMDGFSKINDLINSEGLKSFEKVYFFDKNTAVDSSNAETLGLKKAASSSVKIKVNNPDNYLEAIKVNDQEVNFNRKSEFSILCKNSDKITYKEVGDKKWKPLTGNLLEVRKPASIEPKPRPSSSSKSAPISGYIIIGAIGLILGGAGGYFAPKILADKQDIIDKAQDTSYVSPATYNFKLAPDNKDVVLIADNISGLENYKFKFKEAGQWFYCKSTENYKPLNKQDLKDLIKDASIDSLVISSLETISGHQIPEKDIKVEMTTENDSKVVSTSGASSTISKDNQTQYDNKAVKENKANHTQKSKRKTEPDKNAKENSNSTPKTAPTKAGSEKQITPEVKI